MKPQDNNHPDITAFVMNELEPAAAARMRGLIACSPEVRAEHDRIQRAVAALQSGASIPERSLRPRQRETVLAMSQKPGRASKIAPFTGQAQRKSIFNSLVFKLAAAACLTIGAFMIGHQTATGPSLVLLAQNTTKQTPAAKPITTEVVPVVEQKISGGTITKTVATSPTIAVPSVSEIEEPEKLVPDAPVSSLHTAQHSLESFVIAAAKPETVINFCPNRVRPVKTGITEFAGINFAAPMMENLKPAVNAPVIAKKIDAQPPLVIHSWKAEIASCPWDSARRLMRCVVQIPVDQPGIASNDAEYHLAVKFDPAQVRGYRLVMEKHMPPSGNSNLATRFAWYEIIPVSNFAPARDKPSSLGVVKLVQPRESKDSHTLRLVDRGLSWSEAREDFAFETAMIGFNLLLQGADNIGNLNYKLVLDLAEKSRGEDMHGERTKFIETVEQAHKAAGF